VGHEAHMTEMWNKYNILVRKPEGRDHSEDLDIDGKMILKCILRK